MPSAEHAEKSVTFAGQDDLKKLPIPDLSDTVSRYLSAVSPFQNAKELKRTEAAAQEFLKADGPELQKLLIEYDKDQVSYIEQFWFDSYLNYDNPVVLNLNPFFLLEDDPTPARANQVTRAASLTISSLCFIRCLRREELPPDMIRGKPLCMYQYSRLFGTSRIATDSGCKMQTNLTARHIAVLCRSQFYWFDVLDENNDIILTEQYLAENFRAIIDDASTIPPSQAAKSAMGVLTSESRSVWAGHRAKINEDEDPNNKECLDIIDSALFLVCLDDSEPVGKAAISENMLCGSYDIATGVQVGTCTNRWYDKLQLIVCKNGSAGINFEHTGVDGHTVLRFVSDIYTDTIMRFAKTINPAAPNLWPSMSPDPSKRDPESFGDVDSTPHRLEWKLNSELSTAIRFAETRLSDLLLQNELQILEFTNYGSNFMKQSGFSPDAFVQMAFQAAYYGLYGRVQSVYEPAMTKSFRHGRTEAIRSTTNESVNFVKRFCEDVNPQIKVDALRKACTRHTAITRQASAGEGQDRHLYALFKMWEKQVADHKAGEHAKNPTSSNGDGSDVTRSPSDTSLSDAGHEMPALFADCAWDRLNNTILSTSNCGNPALRMFGFGPTSLDGFGIGYIIKDNSISICASSKHRQTSRFLETLSNYFLEIRGLIREVDELRGVEKEKTRPEDKQKSRSRSGKPVTVTTATEEADDDAGAGMLGGYGYFDFETLDKDILRQKANATKDEDIGNVHRRHAIGRRLRLGEY
ncbi:Carnitine acetyl transferase [Taphrina deformans PYCC 5710]|uniref:Carnitine acetyl transferase n=1 Tax=Taphrina deformans (strain PYCC 5710 / ATCC 11124 / CBS 356.35 / IMI 108563 / JCM 9778 / NBRC 8474) TaxID=1097556 RepID=R4X6C0_TAPDE|nr:Carnitine acetyl transferase [Taphrina deformans PYCC 5710]|eukprot:CCG80555.1 Carnitine acetyl transferase [Taphrina deformans PYCC 5710]